MEDKSNELASRPLPRLEEMDTKYFWQETRNKRLSYQICENCSKVVFHPRAHCPGCLEGRLSWQASSGRGEIYSFSIVRQSYHPFFRGLIPYVVAWIDIDEGFRVLSNVICSDISLADVKIGSRVELEWEEHEQLCIPLFRLI